MTTTSTAPSTRSPERSEPSHLPELVREQLRLLVRTAQAEQRVPSISAAVFRDGEVVWADAVGLANVEDEVEATPDTQYRIGSITKTFTAAAIMQLRDAGKLQLDDPLAEHIPESPHERLTLRRMLSHLSGIQREPPGEIWESMRPPSRDDFLGQLAEAEQVLEPGERWHYSNLAYGLLGEVVARCSGIEYERYVTERLLLPLGLERTTWAPEPPAARPYLVEPYSNAVVAEPDVDLRGKSSAGQLASTTRDLARWGAFLADPDPAVLAPATVDEMHELRVMAEPDWTLGWGLGVMLLRRGEQLFAGHTGGFPGFLSFLVYSRAAKTGAVVLTNSSHWPRLTDTGLALAEKALETMPLEPELWRPEEPPPEELRDVLGRWWSEGQEWIFTYSRGRLEARSADASATKQPSAFEAVAPDEYRTAAGSERGETLRIVRDDAGAPVKLYWATYPFLRTPEPFGALASDVAVGADGTPS